MRAAPAFHLQAKAPMPDIPKPLTFTEMADHLVQAARQEAFGLDALHFFALRDPSSVGLETIAEVKRNCAAYFDISVILRALAPHEDFIRAMASTTHPLQPVSDDQH